MKAIRQDNILKIYNKWASMGPRPTNGDLVDSLMVEQHLVTTNFDHQNYVSELLQNLIGFTAIEVATNPQNYIEEVEW